MHYTYLILRKKTERFCSVLWWTRLKIFSQRMLIAAGCHFQKFPETVWGPHLHHLPLRLLVFATDLHSRIKAESRELWEGVWVFYLRKNKLKVPLVDSQITSYLKELGKAPIFPLKKILPIPILIYVRVATVIIHRSPSCFYSLHFPTTVPL